MTADEIDQAARAEADAQAAQGGGARQNTSPSFNPEEFFNQLLESLGSGPGAREMTSQELELLDLEVARVRKAAALQDQVQAALEKLYGEPFATHFAGNVFRTEQFQRNQLDVADRALARGERFAKRGEQRSEALRSEYLRVLGQSPETIAAEQAKRENEAAKSLYGTFQEGLVRQRESAGLAYDRWRKALRGEEGANPVLERELSRQRQDLNDIGAAQYGPGWESTEFGRRATLARAESEGAQRYATNQDELGRLAPYWSSVGGTGLASAVYTPSPSTSRLLVAQSGLPEASLAQGGSPLTTSGPVLGYLSGQAPGAQGLSGMLQQNRQFGDTLDANRFNTLFGGGLAGLMAGYQDTLARGRQQQLFDFQAGQNDLNRSQHDSDQNAAYWRDIIRAAGTIGASYFGGR